MKSGKKRVPLFIVILAISFILLAAIGLLVPNYLERKVTEQLLLHNGKSTSVEINLFTRSISINGLDWATPEDSITQKRHSVKINSLALRKLSIYQLLSKNSIQFQELLLDSGYLSLDKTKDTTQQKTLKTKYKALTFKRIKFNSVSIRITSDTLENASAHLRGELNDVKLKIDSLDQIKYSATKAELEVENIQVSRHEGMYGGTVSRILISTDKKNVLIDSIHLIPNYGKYEFAHKKGRQIARLNLFITQAEIQGLQFDKIFENTFLANKIEIKSAELFSFKDKRLPFTQTRIIPLPMESFLKLPWKVRVDSTVLTNTTISIEEFPEGGITTGEITFNNVNATILSLNNQIKSNALPYAVINANGLLMGTGRIKAVFLLPLDGKSIYKASGSVSQIPFSALNSILKTVNIRVESGQLNLLTFNFNYTETLSQGALQIDYEDLRLEALDKNKNSINMIKSILINAVVRSNKNQAKAPLKRLGVINVEPNRQKFLFNYWWLSILDGLKSAMTGNTSKPV